MAKKTKAKKTWQKIGSIGIDAGICMVGDPCYHLQRGGSGGGSGFRQFETWGDFVKQLAPVHGGDGQEPKGYVEIGPGLAVVVSTGHGDGCYDVYARFSPDRVGVVEAVKVVFIRRRKDPGP